MKRFALILILAPFIISGCGGGGGGAVTTPASRQTTPNMTLPQWDQTNPATPTTDVIKQWQDGDQLTYTLTANPSPGCSAILSVGELTSTTYLDEVVDEATGKTASGKTLKYGNRSFHVTWDVSFDVSSYTRTSYYEQDAAGNIYYLGYKDSSANMQMLGSVGKPLAYPTHMSEFMPRQYMASYPNDRMDYVGVTVGGAGKVQRVWDAYKVTTTSDNNDGNFISDVWFSPEIGYPVQFRFTYRYSMSLWDVTATLNPPRRI